jgi:hypothetical protein
MIRNLLVIIIAMLVITGCEQQQPPKKDVYPWQVTVLPDGGSRVFGIEFDSTTLEQATDILGNRYDEGLFENSDGSLSLEVYFNEVTLGGISGKFILTLNADQGLLQSMKQRARKPKRMDSGAYRYHLSQLDRQTIGAMTISALGYIPYVNLDKELIEHRFGTPTRSIEVDKGKQHYLYPDKGLDLLLDEDGKEFLQYVAPKYFQQLRAPLIRQYDS